MSNATPPTGETAGPIRPPMNKKPATVMRQHTQNVRDAIASIAHLEEQYFATIKRAEVSYFEGLRRITDALAKMTEESPTQPS